MVTGTSKAVGSRSGQKKLGIAKGISVLPGIYTVFGKRR